MRLIERIDCLLIAAEKDLAGRLNVSDETKENEMCAFTVGLFGALSAIGECLKSGVSVESVISDLEEANEFASSIIRKELKDAARRDQANRNWASVTRDL